jgi:hypothetical protein
MEAEVFQNVELVIQLVAQEVFIAVSAHLAICLERVISCNVLPSV